jgi:hypothetical protein
MANMILWQPPNKKAKINEAMELVKRESTDAALRAIYKDCPVIPEERAVCHSQGGCSVRLSCPAEVQQRPSVVAMLRTCSLFGKPWQQPYMSMPNGHYAPGHPGQLSKAIVDEMFRHPDMHTYRMDESDIKEEKCPWCGSCGWGRLFCAICGPVCWGGVIDNSYLRCHCGSTGKLRTSTKEYVGVIPRAFGS